jgi:hypothetical protein
MMQIKQLEVRGSQSPQLLAGREVSSESDCGSQIVVAPLLMQ